MLKRAGYAIDLDMDAIRKIEEFFFTAAKRHGKPIGHFGACEVFSFHATKFFNTFEGGAITTKALPPLEFRYSHPTLGESVEHVDPTSLDNLPIGQFYGIGVDMANGATTTTARRLFESLGFDVVAETAFGADLVGVRRIGTDVVLRLADHAGLADPGAEADAGDPGRLGLRMNLLHPVEGRSCIAELSDAVVERALALANAAEIEPQHPKAEIAKQLVELDRDPVLHRSPGAGVPMQNQRDRSALP